MTMNDLQEDNLFTLIKGMGDAKDIKEEEEKLLSLPFAKELVDDTLDITRISLKNFPKAIQSASFLNINTRKLIEEYLWKLGGSKEHFFKVFLRDEKHSEYFHPKDRIVSGEIFLHLGKPPYHFYTLNVRFMGFNLENLAKMGSRHMLEYFFASAFRGGFLNDSPVLYAGYGKLDCLKFLNEHGCHLNEDVCHAAAKKGHLECLKYLHENGCPWDEATCYSAAQGGHLECLKYAHENGCPWRRDTCEMAARYGQLECLKYAHENGCPWDERTCKNAAYHGNLECLKYAHENGCPWNEDTCTASAGEGHLECLKYLHENGCPWNSNTCNLAAKFGHPKCLKYALEQGLELTVDSECVEYNCLYLMKKKCNY